MDEQWKARLQGDLERRIKTRGRTVYASATFSGFFVFQRSCASFTFWCAVSAVKGGTMGAIGSVGSRVVGSGSRIEA